MKSTICLAEDRKACEPCLKLLLLSLNRHCPDRQVRLFYPPAEEGFFTWVRKYPQVHIETEKLKGGYGWNIKPHAIMYLLDAGFEEVIWIDSDVLVTSNILDKLSRLKSNTFVATDHTLSEERDDTNGRRARLWGLPVGRVLPSALNSGVLRVTREHYELMEDWWELLRSDDYQEFQKRKWAQRPVHMLGDQDVLTALLTSKKYSEIPLYVLARGKHILQFDGIWGYTVPERLRNLLGDGPAFIHSAAGKPWSEQWPQQIRGVRELVKWLYLDVSPYTLKALPYKHELECDTKWMQPHFRLSRFLRILGLGRAELTGLPMAVFADFARIVKWMWNLGRAHPAVVETGVPESAAKD
jgi:hypothetical protein